MVNETSRQNTEELWTTDEGHTFVVFGNDWPQQVVVAMIAKKRWTKAQTKAHRYNHRNPLDHEQYHLPLNVTDSKYKSSSRPISHTLASARPAMRHQPAVQAIPNPRHHRGDFNAHLVKLARNNETLKKLTITSHEQASIPTDTATRTEVGGFATGPHKSNS